ncbi:MAG: hypothetical protein U1E24_07040, partial [Phenylobacterium sp.]|nr:hypothetical protein [Phenylobacterium sp.]
SYARGDWVDDPVGGYTSDYDLLVVVNHEELTETLEYWAKAEDHLVRDYNLAHADGPGELHRPFPLRREQALEEGTPLLCRHRPGWDRALRSARPAI